MWWYFTKLNLFTNLLNLMQYSSRGGQENHRGVAEYLESNTQSNEVSPRGILKYTRLRLVYFRMPLGDTSLLLVLLFRNTTTA